MVYNEEKIQNSTLKKDITQLTREFYNILGEIEQDNVIARKKNKVLKKLPDVSNFNKEIATLNIGRDMKEILNTKLQVLDLVRKVQKDKEKFFSNFVQKTTSSE